MGLATSRVCHVCGGEIDPQRTERGLSARVGSFGSESCVGNAAEFSDSCAVSPGCGSRSSFREVVCLRFTPRRVPTHSDPHAFSLCGSAADKTPRPPAASRGRGPAPGARGWRSSLLGASFLFTSLELGPAQRQRRHCTRGAGEPAPMPLRSRPSLEVHLGDGLERGSGEDREQLASPAQPLHPNLRQEEPDPSQ